VEKDFDFAIHVASQARADQGRQRSPSSPR
jgi:hypothetical protein